MERCAPEVAAVDRGQEPEFVRQPQARELVGEGDRPGAEHVAVVAADRDVEVDAAAAQAGCVSTDEQRRVVGSECRFAGVDEGAVVEDGGEVALPGAECPEQAWVAEPDVDGAVAAGAQALERAPLWPRLGCEVRVDPGHDVLDDVVLPDAGPFAGVGVHRRPRDGHDGDERLRLARADQPVGDVGEVEAAPDGGGASGHAVKEIDHGVAPRRVVAGRQIDGAGAVVGRQELVGDLALVDHPSGRARAYRRPGGRQSEPARSLARRRRECQERREEGQCPHTVREAAARCDPVKTA